MTAYALHPWHCRCGGLDRVCPDWKRVYSTVSEFIDSPDPARRALGEAARSAVVNGSREAEQSLRAVMQMAEGVTLGQAIEASAVVTLEDLVRERKAALRQRWAAVVGSRVPGGAGDIGL